MTSNINISPAQQLGQTAAILNNLGVERQQMDQMKLAEMARQKAQFQDLINKSFQPVMSQFAEDYNTKQNEFINNASELYKKSGGFLSMKDNMEIKKLQQPLDEYVAYSNASRELYSNLVQKIESSSADKVDKAASLKRLNDAMTINENDDPRTLYDRLNSGGIIQEVIQPDDFSKIGSEIGKLSLTKTNSEDIKNSTIQLPGGGYTYNDQKYNPDKIENLISSAWESRKNLPYAKSVGEVNYKQMLRDNLPEDVKRVMVKGKTGSGGSGKKLIPLNETIDKDPFSGVQTKSYTLTQPLDLIIDSEYYTIGDKGKFQKGEKIGKDQSTNGKATKIINKDGVKYVEVHVGSEGSGDPEAIGKIEGNFIISEGGKPKQMGVKNFVIYVPYDKYKEQIGSKYDTKLIGSEPTGEWEIDL